MQTNGCEMEESLEARSSGNVVLIVDNNKRLKVRYYDIDEQSGAHRIRNVQLNLLYNNSNGNLSTLPSLNLSYSG